ncbi:hypothetical protein [Serratia silvae]|uniref:hypothetical protein n=1 Tax=Serratia silvae TaxID=2824122 RepID=UPI0020107031|nr:hypothetical protein [Serratia silvae]
MNKILNKKLIISIISSSAFITVLTVAVIWLYLSNIDRLDIFHDAVNVKSIMGIILGFAILSILGFSILLFISSLMLIIAYAHYERNLKKYNGIEHDFALTGMFNCLISCLLLILLTSILYYIKLNSFIIISLFLLPSMFFSFFLTNNRILKSRKYLSQDSNEEDSFLKKWSTKYFMPFFLLTPAIAQVLPLFFLLQQFEVAEGSKEFTQASLIIILALMYTMLSILPGTIYINEKKNGKILRIITIILICIPTTLAIFSIFIRPIPNMIINMTMNLSGISDSRIHEFYIDKKTHSHTMFNSALWSTRYYQDIPNRFFITGVNIFTLGDIKLICPARIIAPRKASLKITPDNTNEYDRKIKQLKAIAMQCVPLNKNDIYTWDSPISDPIYY